MFKQLKKNFGSSSKKAQNILAPTGIEWPIHVSTDPETGLLKGLPDDWIKVINNQIPEELQKENPGAVLDAIRCYVEEDVKAYDPPPVFSKAQRVERKLREPKSLYLNTEILDMQKHMISDKILFDEFSKMCKTSNPRKKYEIKKQIGKGASGVVFIATDKDKSTDVAIKTINMKTQVSGKNIYEELCLVRELTHKNLISFVDSFFLNNEKSLWIIMEYMNGGRHFNNIFVNFCFMLIFKVL
jgi:hypothetical protein